MERFSATFSYFESTKQSKLILQIFFNALGNTQLSVSVRFYKLQTQHCVTHREICLYYKYLCENLANFLFLFFNDMMEFCQ